MKDDVIGRVLSRLVHDDVHLAVDTIYSADASPWGVPAVRFHIIADQARTGTISLRDGHTYIITHLAGHVGFGIDEPYRGRSLAEKAVRALLPLVQEARLWPLSFTTTPENKASRRTLGKLGCELVERVPVPPDYETYAKGEREKLRYVLRAPSPRP